MPSEYWARGSVGEMVLLLPSENVQTSVGRDLGYFHVTRSVVIP